MMRPPLQERREPHWLVFVFLPIFHFATVKLTFFCGVTPENEVVVWLPNSVLLAALLRFDGRRGWLMALLTFSSDVIGNLPSFPATEAVLLSLVNLSEVVLTWFLMRRAGASSRLERLVDLTTFIVVGPVISACIAGVLGGAVIRLMEAGQTPYFTLMRLWWFGDGLGLLIYTPLLLTFTQSAESVKFRAFDVVVIAGSIALAVVIFSAGGSSAEATSLTPTLLLPSALYVAARFGVRWASATVALISLTCAWVLTVGREPFGPMPMPLEIVRAQEFILTLSIVGLGFSVLLNELKIHERSLESKVRERTSELELSNEKLRTMSMTDGLTGIANRRRFDEVLSTEWQRARQNGQSISLALIDVDWFKHFNDRYGHLAGDDCLRSVARIIGAAVGPEAVLAARYGGEEFALIVAGAGQQRAARLAGAVRHALANARIEHAGSPLGVVSVSIGIATMVPTPRDSSQTLVALADAALYEVKSTGRNQVRVADATEEAR